MPRRESAPTERAHVWLFSDDLRWIRETYGGRIPLAKVIRSIVHAFRLEAEAKINQANDSVPRTQLSLEELVSADELAD